MEKSMAIDGVDMDYNTKYGYKIQV